MKRAASVVLSCLLPLVSLPSAFAQDEPAEADASPEAPPEPTPDLSDAAENEDLFASSLKDIPEEERERLSTLLNEAAQYVAGIRLQEALQNLAEAEEIAPNLFELHNIRGAVYTKMKFYDKAREAFERAAKLRPEVFHPRFNLAELDFVTKDYAASEKSFKAILEEHPDLDEGTRALIRYKIMLSKLKQDDVAGAKEILSGFSYLDDTPVYYLGKAAVEFHAGNSDEAESWLQSARNIYDERQLNVFLDALIEAEWIDTI